jgi:hypothetical protein
LGDRQEIQEVKNAYMAYGEVRTKIKGNILFVIVYGGL